MRIQGVPQHVATHPPNTTDDGLRKQKMGATHSSKWYDVHCPARITVRAYSEGPGPSPGLNAPLRLGAMGPSDQGGS